MRVAVVSRETGEVVNVIMADPDRDAAPPGCMLVVLKEADAAEPGAVYDARGAIFARAEQDALDIEAMPAKEGR